MVKRTIRWSVDYMVTRTKVKTSYHKNKKLAIANAKKVSKKYNYAWLYRYPYSKSDSVVTFKNGKQIGTERVNK